MERVECDSHTHGNAHTNADANSHCHAHGDPDTYSDADSGDTNADPYWDRSAHAYSNSYSDTDRHADTDTYAYSDADADKDSYTYANHDDDDDTYSHDGAADTDADCIPNRDTDADSGGPNAHADAGLSDAYTDHRAYSNAHGRRMDGDALPAILRHNDSTATWSDPNRLLELADHGAVRSRCSCGRGGRLGLQSRDHGVLFDHPEHLHAKR